MIKNMQISKEEYEYLGYMLLVKIVGFLQVGRNRLTLDDLEWIAEQLNLFYSGKYSFEMRNIVSIGKKVIDADFSRFIDKMCNGIISPELSLTENKLKEMYLNLKNSLEKGTDSTLEYHLNRKYYIFFTRMQYLIEEYNSSRCDICGGETIYHSFARFYAEGVDDYFEYFRKMDDLGLVNHQNQEQERGFCDRIPCSFWFLDSKKNLEYYNEIITTKDIKLNHISGNEHGPSSFCMIASMLIDNIYYNRKNRCYVELEDDHRNLLFQTVYNIVKSNYSLAYDFEYLLELFSLFRDNYYIQKSIEYLISDIGIETQKKNNEYPVYKGGIIDVEYNEELLDERLCYMIDYLRKIDRPNDLIKVKKLNTLVINKEYNKRQ